LGPRPPTPRSPHRGIARARRWTPRRRRTRGKWEGDAALSKGVWFYEDGRRLERRAEAAFAGPTYCNIIAARDIHPGEQISVAYGPDFWSV
jgi:hypothetical protein